MEHNPQSFRVGCTALRACVCVVGAGVWGGSFSCGVARNDEGFFDCDVNPTLTNFIEREVGTIYQEYYGPALIAKSNNQGQTIGLTEQDIIHITQEVLPSMQELT